MSVPSVQTFATSMQNVVMLLAVTAVSVGRVMLEMVSFVNRKMNVLPAVTTVVRSLTAMTLRGRIGVYVSMATKAMANTVKVVYHNILLDFSNYFSFFSLSFDVCEILETCRKSQKYGILHLYIFWQPFGMKLLLVVVVVVVAVVLIIKSLHVSIKTELTLLW